MPGNSWKNVTTLVIALLAACVAAVFTFSPQVAIFSTTPRIASQILPGNSWKNEAILSTMFRKLSQCSYSNLTAPANGFVNNNRISCQLSFTKSTTLLSAFGIVSVKNFAISPTTFPTVSFTTFQAFTTAVLAVSFDAMNPTIAATAVATNVIINIILLAAIAALTSFCAAAAATSPPSSPFTAATTPLIIDATLNTANPAPIAANKLAIVSPWSAIQPSPSRILGNTATIISLAFSTRFPKPVAILSSAPLSSPLVKSVCKSPITFVIFVTAFFNGVSNFS